MGGLDPQGLDHIADSVLPPDPFVFPHNLCYRFSGAAVDHDITWIPVPGFPSVC